MPVRPTAAPDRPLELFCVLRQPTTPGQQPRIMASTPLRTAEVTRRYPMLDRFCFPEKPGTAAGGEVSFTFVMTSEDGRHTYGHCVRTVNGDVLCVISRFAWCRLFRDLMFQYRANGEDTAVIEALHRATIPRPGRCFILRPADVRGPSPAKSSVAAADAGGLKGSTSPAAKPASAAAAADHGSPARAADFHVNLDAVDLRRPPDGYNPFVDAHPALLLRWMSADTLLHTMASLLTERRIAIVGPDVGTVSSVILALLSLMRPFEWAHVLVPVVPHSLLGVLAAPTPLLVGLLANQVDEALAQGGVNNLVLVQLRGCAQPTVDAIRSSMRGNEHSSSSLSRGSSSIVSDREGGFSAPDRHSSASTVDLIVMPGSEEEALPVPHLPWTDSSLGSMRIAMMRAKTLLAGRPKRRKGEAPSAAYSAATVEADRLLLDAFLDFYVHAFGRSLRDKYDPVSFIEDALERRSGYSSKEVQRAREFYAAAMECILYMQFRDRYVPALRSAEQRAESAAIQSLEGQMPEEGGFAAAVLLTHPDLYPNATLLAQKDQSEREKDKGAVRTTLVTLSAPLWSLRGLSRMCSYGFSTVTAATVLRKRANGGAGVESASTDADNPVSPGR